MYFLKNIYNLWAVICIVNTAISLLAFYLPIEKWTKTEDDKGLIKLIKNIVTAIAVMLIALSAGTYLFFTKVPNVVGLNMSETRRCLRDNNLDDKYLPNLRYDSMAVNAEVNFQSIDEGEIVPKNLVIYLGFAQDANMFSGIIGNTKNNYDGDSPDHKTNIDGSNNNYDDDSLENQTTNPDNNIESINQDGSKAIVPDVVGMEQDDAIRVLYMAGLQFQVFGNYNDDSYSDKYYVINQGYTYGDSVDLGSVC